jgi:curved DNA-binding protein CbpA
MPDLPNHYEALGVRPNADAPAIKRAYYEKMRQHHPDNFIAEHKRLEIVGDRQALRRLDERIASAAKQTQVINAAYAVLSDTERRAHYDWLREAREKKRIEATFTGSPDDLYDAHRPRRPHGRPPSPGKTAAPPKPESFPAILAIGFLIFLTLSTAFVSQFLIGPTPRRPRVDLPPTINIPAGSMDATARAAQRTLTPRPAQSYLISGDALFNAGLYENAIAEYTHAIEQLAGAAGYFRRGRAYAATDKFDQALENFDQAQVLDPSLVDLYRERGLLYFRQWQANGTTGYAEAARRDLDEYLRLDGDASAYPEIAEALAALDL